MGHKKDGPLKNYKYPSSIDGPFKNWKITSGHLDLAKTVTSPGPVFFEKNRVIQTKTSESTHPESPNNLVHHRWTIEPSEIHWFTQKIYNSFKNCHKNGHLEACFPAILLQTRRSQKGICCAWRSPRRRWTSGHFRWAGHLGVSSGEHTKNDGTWPWIVDLPINSINHVDFP